MSIHTSIPESDWTKIVNAINAATRDSSDPSWTDITSAIGAVALGVGALFVAWMQWRLEKQRSRRELLDHRMAVYFTLNDALKTIHISDYGEKPSEKLLRDLKKVQIGAQIYFSKKTSIPIYNLIERIEKLNENLRIVREMKNDEKRNAELKLIGEELYEVGGNLNHILGKLEDEIKELSTNEI